MPRTDREDTSAQAERVTAARAALREALEGVVVQCGGHGDLAAVAEEARILVRTLASRARRPPPVDLAAFLGRVSAAERAAARPDPWDDAVRAVRHAEAALDLADYDLATARGEHG